MYNDEKSIPKMLRAVEKDFSDVAVQKWVIHTGKSTPQKRRGGKSDDCKICALTYREFRNITKDVAAGFLSMGVERGENVALICDNRPEWQQLTMGLLSIGARDVPRGCDATMGDLETILSVADCKVVIAENISQVNKILKIATGVEDVKEITGTQERKKLLSLATIVMIDDADEQTCERVKFCNIDITSMAALVKVGQKYNLDNSDTIEREIDKGDIDDTACIIFTSGTTGTPKGVELSHKNFLAQLDELPERIILNPGDNVMAVLPVWHVFERACEYIMMVQAATIAYSKPIGSILLADMQRYNPALIPAVPRIFEAIYDGVMKKVRASTSLTRHIFKFFLSVAIIHSRMGRLMFNKNVCFTRYYTVFWWFLFIIPWTLLWPLKFLGNLLVFRSIKAMVGKKFRGGVVGGGAFPKYIDEFFWAIGLNVVEGYGLTETAPVISVRHLSCPVFGNVGSPIRRVQARVVSIDNGFVLGRGQFGAIQIRGDTVMKGYYKNPELTKKVITSDGWFDTGDLGMISIHDEIVIKGRKKDTIVLSGGENVEPAPMEMFLSKSRYIKQAVIVGQDKHYLGALVLINSEEVKSFAGENGLQYESFDALLKSEAIQKLFESEISALINPKNGFKIYERINRFVLVTKDFEIGVELSAKQEVMRHRIAELYKTQIASMFDAKG